MADENNTASEADIQALMDQVSEDGSEDNKEVSGGSEAGGAGGEASTAQAKAATAEANEGRNLDLIMDIPLKVSVELGRSRMLVTDLLNLGQGSVIELNKLAGEALEILVNDKIIAKGEAVVVNEKFGVRLTDIISPMERVQKLK